MSIVESYLFIQTQSLHSDRWIEYECLNVAFLENKFLFVSV